MDLDELVAFGKEQIFKGSDFLELKESLMQVTNSVDKVNKVLIILEPEFVNYQLAEQERTKVLNQVLVGGVLLIIGLSMILYTNITGQYRSWIYYGLILGGAWWTIRNIAIYRQPLQNFIPIQEIYRKRRFRK